MNFVTYFTCWCRGVFAFSSCIFLILKSLISYIIVEYMFHLSLVLILKDANSLFVNVGLIVDVEEEEDEEEEGSSDEDIRRKRIRRKKRWDNILTCTQYSSCLHVNTILGLGQQIALSELLKLC